MLDEIKLNYIQQANNIKGWETANKNDLAAGYLDSEGNPIIQDSYVAALICRYWNNLAKYSVQNKNAPIPIEECYSWLITGMLWALNELKNKWRDPSNKLYGDPCGADKVINRCLFSARAGAFQDYNRDKRRLNYQSESLDMRYDEFGDYYDNLFSVEPSINETPNSLNPCWLLIQSYIDKGKIIEAILLDNICFQDCFKDGSLYQRKLVADIKHMNKAYKNYFKNNYDITTRELNETIKKIDSLSNTRVYTIIKHLLKELKGNKLCF